MSNVSVDAAQCTYGLPLEIPVLTYALYIQNPATAVTVRSGLCSNRYYLHLRSCNFTCTVADFYITVADTYVLSSAVISVTQ